MNILFTGGGTGGHLVIASSLATTAIARGHRVAFIGSTSGQDQQWFKESSLFEQTYFLETTGVVNKKGIGAVIALWKIIKAVFVSRNIIRRFGADAVVSVGGFSAAPAAIASLTLGCPLSIHEQNAVTGRLNKLLRPYAKGFYSSYEEGDGRCDYPVSDSYFHSSHIRSEIKTIIFLGGSQGAMFINNLALEIAGWLNDRGIHIIHQCGAKEEERVRHEYQKMGVDAEVYGFTDQIASLINRSDFAISRSGASTLWELCASQVPTFFIPYPSAAGDHQYHNARYIIDHDAGWCERQGEGIVQKLQEAIMSNPEAKSKKLAELIAPHGATKILQLIEN